MTYEERLQKLRADLKPTKRRSIFIPEVGSTALYVFQNLMGIWILLFALFGQGYLPWLHTVDMFAGIPLFIWQLKCPLPGEQISSFRRFLNAFRRSEVRTGAKNQDISPVRGKEDRVQAMHGVEK